MTNSTKCDSNTNSPIIIQSVSVRRVLAQRLRDVIVAPPLALGIVGTLQSMTTSRCVFEILSAIYNPVFLKGSRFPVRFLMLLLLLLLAVLADVVVVSGGGQTTILSLLLMMLLFS